MRGLDALYFTVGLVAVVLMVESSAQQAAVVLLAVGVGGVHLTSRSQYGRFSLVLAMAATAATLHESPLVAGLLVGMSILGKYSTGLIALISLVLATMASDGVPGAWVLFIGAFVITGLAVVVLGPSGMRSFVATAVMNKPVYLVDAGRGPVTEMRRAIRQTSVGVEGRLLSVPRLVALGLFAGVAVGFPLGVYRWFEGGSTVSLLGAALCVIAVASSYPRFDWNHVALTSPALAAALFMVYPGDGWLSALAAVLGAVCLASGWLGLLVELRRSDSRRDVASMRLLPVRRINGVWPDDVKVVVQTAGPEVFLVNRAAPMFYVASELVNPTKYDYPLSSTFGRSGQADVIAALDRGEIEWACHEPIGPPLGPSELEDYLSSRGEGLDTPLGSLTNHPPASP